MTRDTMAGTINEAQVLQQQMVSNSLSVGHESEMVILEI